MLPGICEALPAKRRAWWRGALAAAAALAAFAAANPAWGQPYPAKPIKLVVPYPAGGPADVLGRIVAQKISVSLGQPIIVENRSGANGIIGTEAVARAAPDGYTMVINTGSTTINAHVYHKMPFDLMRDLAPVTLVAAPSGLVLVASPSLGVGTVKELVAVAKSKPGRISFASSGSGSALQLAGELFAVRAGLKLIHVPYKGAAPAFNDLLSGQVQLMFPAPISVMPYVNSGRLKILAQTGPERQASLPDVPTFKELGMGNFAIMGWFGIWVPAGTPDPIIRRLQGEIAGALKLPDVQQRFSALGAVPSGITPEAFGAFVREDFQRIGRYIEESGMHLD